MHLGIDYHSTLVGFGLQVRVEKQFKTDVEKHQKLRCFWQDAGAGQEGKEFTHSLVRGMPAVWAEGFARIRSVLYRLIGYLAALRFCIVFAMPFWIDF